MILLFSGGIDSFVAYHYLDKPSTLYFDIGSRYTRLEIDHIRRLIPDTIVDTTLYLGDTERGDKAYIPFRNLFLALKAVKYSDTIVIAGLKDDMVSDKNEQIFSKFSVLMSEMEGRRIQVISPFWNKTKYEVVEWYKEYIESTGNTLRDTISCYSGTSSYCGQCPACFRKWCVLTANNIDIQPFKNKELIEEYISSAEANKYDPIRNEIIIEYAKKLL